MLVFNSVDAFRMQKTYSKRKLLNKPKQQQNKVSIKDLQRFRRIIKKQFYKPIFSKLFMVETI